MRRILWEPEPIEMAPAFWVAPVVPPPPVIVVPDTPSGNGHKRMKIRDLEQHEKDKIETLLFVPSNGQIYPDMCVQFKATKLPAEVAIFQVTGYVTALHGRVARGKLHVRNAGAYETFIRNHRALWRTYDSPRYKAMREQALPVNQHRTPRFAAVSTRR
jgi:hypothetical protein